MMTNNIKKYLIAGSVCCAATAVTTSCSDFLDILKDFIEVS